MQQQQQLSFLTAILLSRDLFIINHNLSLFSCNCKRNDLKEKTLNHLQSF